MSAKNLLLLFDRPHEPVYVPKGNKQVVLDVPTNYLPEKYQPVASEIFSRVGTSSETSIPIKQIAIPDLSLPLSLGRRDGFSLFLPAHQKMASNLVEIFLGMRTVEDLLSLAAYCRDRINSQMFVYALSIAILHRPDTKNLPIPQLSEIFPDKYMDSSIFNRAKEEANVMPTGSRIPIEIPLDYTATDADPEHRVAYWREDIGINLHHWHWHLVYPFSGPMVVVNKDRRGELFYYMHHQILARYNAERLCNNLPRVRRLTNLRDPIPEAYFPKLDQIVAGRSWPARPAGYSLSDLDRKSDQLKIDLADLERFRDRIFDAIHTNSVRNNAGSTVRIDEKTGIDVLGNMVEASILSPSRTFYGDLHNLGHLVIAYCHDPDHRYLESFSIMGDSTTAMRDPVFYRWHAFIDSLFTEYKDSLPAYTLQQLVFPGVSVSNIRINTSGANPNTLNSHWTKSDIDLSRGLDFTPRGSIFARVQHLNHDFYTYTITANNSNNKEVLGTVRIFITPKFDETGRQLTFNDQRMLMIEMDKFTVPLSRGQNIINRMSNESALTIPFEATFRNVDENRPDEGDFQSFDEFNYCGCGWPQHMLVPKGTKQGYPMDMFVMISNYELDRVNQADSRGCRDGVSFCGLRDLKYPDTQSMGFPFDRVARVGVNSLHDFLTPNMNLQQITVRFNDVIKPRLSYKKQTNESASASLTKD
ncbi:PREDICTED: phenoloxidase 2-like [Ceratosolen solmsi marchali]|uniref:Phenoloxidase 2-like n=1 Tax=Ceratosolen solmsi marchali TaxID=326594 RepID=A0AAJ6YBC4_9HYME|nr:PREDICTED: phenoloxidase 2-like [Ceratosolen solmsi marchali]